MTDTVEHRCRDCGYWLGESTPDAKGGYRTVCRKCRRSQLIRLGEQTDPPPKPRPQVAVAA